MDIKFLESLMLKGLEHFGRYYSKYRAFVVDNDDPKKLSRLKLLIPEIAHEPLDYWAPHIGVYAGRTQDGTVGYGCQVIPEKGDVVMVEFERGHPDKPMWTHGYWAYQSKDIPEKPEDEDLTDINSYWFQTPKGHRVMINDTKDLITVRLASGKMFKINEDAASIVHDTAVSLGSEDESAEPAVLGDKHNKHESKTLQAIQQLTVMTAMGPSSIPINVDTFVTQEQDLLKILSQKVTLD